MDQKHPMNKSAVVVSVALLLVALLLLVAFIMTQSGGSNHTIVLPADQPENAAVQLPETAADSDFIQVTTENVLQVLRSIAQPAYYHQTYDLYVTAQRGQIRKNVELWHSDGLLRAEIDDGSLVKYLLTDGEQVWIWYDQEPDPVCVDLEEPVQIEDLLGLPAFDYLHSLEQEQIVDAEYQTLDSGQIQCIYVCAQRENGDTSRYWIDMHSGLLYQSDILEQSRQVYEVRQDEVSILAPGDQAFTGRFCLPDGRDPFTAKTQTPLP